MATFLFAGLTFIFILAWSSLCKKFQRVRAWTWWLRIRLFNNRFNAVKVDPIKSFNVFYKHVIESIDLVSNALGISRTNQNSPPGMPLAIASVEFYEHVMDMVWLLVNKDVGNDVAEGVYTEITKTHKYHGGKEYFAIEENQKLFDDGWKKPLNISFEKQNHYLMTYQEFTTIFTTSLNEIG